MNVWTEHRNPEGRTYWFNTGTRESVWEKPDDLKSPFERALNQTKWKEYVSGGRKYYYNTETRESKWDMPDELLLVLEKVEKEKPAPTAPVPSAITAPGFTPVGSATPATPSSATPNGVTSSAVGQHTGGLPLSSSSILPARPNIPEDPVIPHNDSPLKAGVDPSFTWDQTMRAIITDPLYKALNTLAEKKAVFEKYTTNLKIKEQEEKDARLAKLRPAIRNMLKAPHLAASQIESERRLIFEEYVNELKQREVQESRAARSRSVAKVVNLFKQLDVDVLTRWRSAHNLILDSEEWTSDPELRKLPTLDILLAFEDYSRVREREYEEQMRRAQVEKTRKERKAREAFKELLESLVASGDIKARTKWKDVYPKFKDDDRYINMLGNPGSNQLELFWDVVDAMDQKLDAKIAIVMNREAEKENGVSKSSGFVIGPTTTEEEYLTIVKAADDDDIKTLSGEELHLIFDTLRETALKKQAEEKRRTERKQRHLQEDLRYALRKLPEPIDLTLSYEEAVPLIEHLPEFQAIEDEDHRRSAFAKFVKRQKERIREAAGSEDGGSTSGRKRKEPPRTEHSRERERGDRDRHDREREVSYRDRERERGSSGKDYDSRPRHHYRHDDYDRKGSRDYERDYRTSSSKHHDKDDRRRGDKEKGASSSSGRRGEYRDWDEPRHEEREKSVSSAYKDKDESSKSEKREMEDQAPDDRVEKRPRIDEPARESSARADTPEEGEI
ncbi:hypothetical protein BDP27DRAFT_1413156 [Rhodocollybia butyracea]|uniref:Uncharacterized protein n=1 Tax=Rhodocollybia butyracea TaxID=206335 RepID=A0A9P5Q4G4_9AGAR|nr:hypothetical protein BDP27DRAFT_1413156 [Rhodocollybia butyracea]